jgi:hypothetical protein
METRECAELVYFDDEIEAFYLNGAGDFLLVTFSDLSTQSNRRNFWAEKYCRSTSTPAIGIVAKAPNWFPESSMLRAAEATRHLLSQYRERITYGHSMGAYAALRYGALFQATTSLAFSPQLSIDPADTAGFDTRYASYYSGRRHGSAMKVVASNLATHVYIFFDPLFKEDAGHVNLLKDAGNVSLVKVPASGHDSIRFFVGAEFFSKIVNLARAREVTTLREQIKARRRFKRELRQYYLAQACIRRHPSWAQALIQDNADRFTEDETATLLGLMADHAISTGHHTEAQSLLDEAFALTSGRHSLTLWRLSELAFRRGDRRQRVFWARRAAATASAPSHVYVAELCIDEGLFREARDELELALKLHSNNAQIMRTLALLYEATGDRMAALAFSFFAAKLDPSNTQLRELYENARQKFDAGN